MLTYRPYALPLRAADAAWVAGTSATLGLSEAEAAKAAAWDFRTPHLHVYPRALFAAARRRVAEAHGGKQLNAVLAQRQDVSRNSTHRVSL